MRLPCYVAADGLDASWAQALGQLFQTRAQAGADYIFTYGPLGYFNTQAYEPALFWWKLTWEIALSSACAFILVRLARHIPWWEARLAFGMLAFVLLPGCDTQYVFPMIGGALLLLWDDRPGVFKVGSCMLFLAVLGLVKFTFLVLGVVLTGMVCLAMALVGRWGVSFFSLVSYGGFFLLGWLAAGQSVAHLPLYCLTSLEIASGYSEAMTLPGRMAERMVAALILASFTFLCLGLVRRENRSLRGMLGAAVLLLGLALHWKHGFVRQDGHVVVFFSYAALASFLLSTVLPAGWGNVAARFLAFGIPVLAVVGWLSAFEHGARPTDAAVSAWENFERNRLRLFDPWDMKQQLDKHRLAKREAWMLPRVREHVGGRSIDLLNWDQGVLFLNDLNWRPRPVFQSYTAYTPALAQANADFYRGPLAPDFVLVRLRHIDYRFPLSEDHAVWRVLLSCYRPVLSEKGYVLFERVAASGPAVAEEGELVEGRTIRFEEEVLLPEVGEDYLTVSFRFHYTSRGALRRAFYRVPPIFLEVTLAQGEQRRFRLVPGLASGTLLLSPLCEENRDVIALYAGENRKKVRAVRIVTDEAGRTAFQRHIEVVVRRSRPWIGLPERTPELKQMLFPMMKTAPDEVESEHSVRVEKVGWEPVLFVHPEGRLTYAIPDGAAVVRGRFGILRDAYERGTTDGVLFQVELEDAAGRRKLLFERWLDPRHSMADRGSHAFEVPLPRGATGKLHLRTTNLSGADTFFDWSYWTDVEIEKIRGE